MSKTPRTGRRSSSDLADEYKFDYSKAKPNRFAWRMMRPVVAVVLESDVAAVFDSSAKVNAQLRSAISAASTGSRRRRRARGTEGSANRAQEPTRLGRAEVDERLSRSCS